MIEPVLAEKKEEVRQRRNRRQIEYYHSVVKPYKEAHPEAKSELMPAKVKSNEYTEYQKKIVRGEIPYDHRLAEFDQGSAYTTGNKTVGRAHCGGAERQKDRP